MHIKNKRKTGGEGPPVFLCFAWCLARKVVGSQDRDPGVLIRIDSDRKLYRVILAAIKRIFFPCLVLDVEGHAFWKKPAEFVEFMRFLLSSKKPFPQFFCLNSLAVVIRSQAFYAPWSFHKIVCISKKKY